MKLAGPAATPGRRGTSLLGDRHVDGPPAAAAGDRRRGLPAATQRAAEEDDRSGHDGDARTVAERAVHASGRGRSSASAWRRPASPPPRSPSAGHAGRTSRSQGRPDPARVDDPAEVERLALAADDPARLGRRVQRGGDEARGDEDEDHPVMRKKRERFSRTPPRRSRSRARSRREAEDHAEARRHRVARVLEGGDQEDRGLEPLAQHGEERQGDERGGGALFERGGRLRRAAATRAPPAWFVIQTIM